MAEAAAAQFDPAELVAAESWPEPLLSTFVYHAGRVGVLRRNLCVMLGNSGDARYVPALARAAGDPDPTIRLHAAWALGRFGTDEAAGVLSALANGDPDPRVRDEARAAEGHDDRAASAGS